MRVCHIYYLLKYCVTVTVFSNSAYRWSRRDKNTVASRNMGTQCVMVADASQRQIQAISVIATVAAAVIKAEAHPSRNAIISQDTVIFDLWDSSCYLLLPWRRQSNKRKTGLHTVISTSDFVRSKIALNKCTYRKYAVRR